MWANNFDIVSKINKKPTSDGGLFNQ